MSQTKLAARAQTLSRQIFASLPFEVRFGFLIEALVEAWTQFRQTLGRALYAEYIKAGVPDMPPIGDTPAEEHPAKELGAKAMGKLPASYGGEHASKIITLVRRNIPIEEDAKEFLQDFMVKLLQGKLGDALQKESHNLKSVQSFVVKLVDWRSKDYQKKKRREKSISLTEGETGGTVDIEDPGSLRGVLQRIRPGDRDKLVRDLKSIDPKHPDWPEQFIMGKLEGKTLREMAPELGKDYSTIGGWWNKYEPKIQAIFEKYFWSMAEAV